jgi:hypothetical protein
MKPIPKVGIILGLLVVGWTFVMGMTGWYKDPALLNLFWVVVLIQVVVLVWGLRLTAADNTYGQQVLAGLLMSLIGGAIIFCGSLLFTTVAFPQYFAELKALGQETLRAQGKSEAEIVQILAMTGPTQTPFWQALFGAIGTLLTGLVASLVIAAVVRKKSDS